jgi:Sterol-sensing domain of SREBP cleavage-activation
MLAFFASVGVGILMGIKVNLTIAWTLPFVILGLGVDNVYIILISLQKQGDYTEKGFFNGMKEVLIPITMTTLVNGSMVRIPFNRHQQEELCNASQLSASARSSSL